VPVGSRWGICGTWRAAAKMAMLSASFLQRSYDCVADCNEREERYLIVTCTVIADVPEPFCPLPVAVMAKASLPLYLAFAVYW